MPTTTLTGKLTCSTMAEAERVCELLPRHIELTRAEPGVLQFDFTVDPEDPLVFHVSESFVDRDALTAHQNRTAASDWGRQTAGIPRHYEVQDV
ncbi:antibiotic biosynthesis monooxygenase [Mesobaculum littorinae]|uniref:Antibiotic biosynthesis monooxygenase n=1 Tax=Mesobaculum littorinae TaxID=2486419 RepID=A0A438ALY0_9RHOB|nr:antibiotic biosynthesis monooxygenase [Mesobaculum littorinae]RVV99863.1 antibiotic biosynthesis monooxygenase [Mesobaculum littorinae]